MPKDSRYESTGSSHERTGITMPVIRTKATRSRTLLRSEPLGFSVLSDPDLCLDP